jgi:urease accessory protein
LRAIIPLVGLFALFHGYAHGAEMSASASGFSYGIGFLMTTAILLLGGIGIGLAGQKMNSPKMVRVFGYSIALCGVWLILPA